MKKITRAFVFLLLIFAVYYLAKSGFFHKTKQGRITIINLDAKTQLPIKDTEYTIIDLKSAKVVEVVKTDRTGKGMSRPLDYGTGYKIKQIKIMNPYQLDSKELKVEINADNQQISNQNSVFSYVKGYQRTDTGDINITKVDIPVATLMQKPELPNGCEITSLTAVLNSYGYKVSKTEMADKYLPKQPFGWSNGKLYGPNPDKAYGGNPRDQQGAFFAFAPPIVDAANQYLAQVGGDQKAIDLTGSTQTEIFEQLDKGIPVVIWITTDMQKPKLTYSWYFSDTGEKYIAPINLHVAVLRGYDANNVYVMNPLKGQVTYKTDSFFSIYTSMGSRALIIESKK